MAGPKDVDGIVALSAALFAEDAGSRDPFTDVRWPEAEGHDHFRGFLDREDAVCLLAVIEGGIVGYLAGHVGAPISLRPVRVAELESMYVSKDHRSGGLGTELVGTFREWARGRGAERMSVTAYAANERAIQLYKRLGFEPKNLSLETTL